MHYHILQTHIGHIEIAQVLRPTMLVKVDTMSALYRSCTIENLVQPLTRVPYICRITCKMRHPGAGMDWQHVYGVVSPETRSLNT